MRRWNGWGEASTAYPLPPSVAQLLTSLLGVGTPPRDATLDEVVAAVPPSRLSSSAGIVTEPLERVRHARGQSFPDLIALRSGQIPVFPDGVAYPMSNADVRAFLQDADEVGAQVIPYGGGTSVAGQVTPLAGDAPVLTMDLSRLNRLHSFEEEDRLATFGAGVAGPDLEAQLRARGYTLGHFPQSFELSTLGGWIATRSSGQQSLGYGRMDELFAGGKLLSPMGTLDLPAFPASSSGPDLRQMVLGSEGRMGIITEATVRVTPLPQRETFHGLFFPTWEQARTAAREMAQSGVPLSMVRVSTPSETATNLAFARPSRRLSVLEKVLELRGAGAQKCLLIIGFKGDAAAVEMSRKTAFGIASRHGGVHVGQGFGRQWLKGRFRAPYLRNELWEHGYGVDTVETATTWSRVQEMIDSVEMALRDALVGWNERVHAFTHLSHLYPDGSNVYTTFAFRLGRNAEETYQRWHALKSAASQAIVSQGGTISHQHGVGTDHRPYLVAEKGKLGMAAIQQVVRVFDPAGMLNPGKLV